MAGMSRLEGVHQGYSRRTVYLLRTARAQDSEVALCPNDNEGKTCITISAANRAPKAAVARTPDSLLRALSNLFSSKGFQAEVATARVATVMTPFVQRGRGMREDFVSAECGVRGSGRWMIYLISRSGARPEVASHQLQH